MWGGANIFLVRSDGTEALLLTKSADGQAMPNWSPDGKRLALVSRRGERLGIAYLTGLEPYYERLLQPPRVNTFERLRGLH